MRLDLIYIVFHVTSSWVLENIQNILIKYQFTKANGWLINYCYWKKVLQHINTEK